MSQRMIQHRFGNYNILGLLSYGSTSHVFKITQIESRMSINSLSSTQQSPFELVSIDMTHNRQQQILQHGGQSTNVDRKDMILKLYNLERMLDKKSNQLLDEIKYDLLIEVIMLMYVHHPGVIQAKQLLIEYENNNVRQNNNRKKLSKIGIVMQICQKGSLNSLCNYINRTKALKQNKLKIMKFYLSQIATTLMYINNSCRLLHRDIKAENIMINKQLDIKIIDYGVARITLEYVQRIFHHRQRQHIFRLFNFDYNITVQQLYGKITYHQTHRRNLIGSRHYISPQLVQKYHSDIQLISSAYNKTDIWSFGILIYKIFHDKYPFDGRNVRQTIDLIVDDDKYKLVEINSQLPKQVQDLIRKCLTKDYMDRAGWEEIITCQFFKDIQMEEIFMFESPIVSILQQHRRQKSQLLQSAQHILFDQKLILKYQDQTSKKRRVLILKQQLTKHYKILILKQKQSVSLQIQLTSRDSIHITKDEQFLIMTFHNGSQQQQQVNNNEIRIFSQNDKEMVERLVDCINDVLRLIELQNNNQQKLSYSQNEENCQKAQNP